MSSVTRVTMRTVLASLAEGDSIEEILGDFPSLTAEDVQAAIAFAAAALGATSLKQMYLGKTYVIWNGSWANVDKNITTLVTSFRGKNGRPDHPETTPHNPWKN